MTAGRSAMAAVVESVMTVLENDGPLTTIVPGGAWDYVPPDPTWPYLCIESAEEAPNDSYGAQGRTVTISLLVFSKYQGRKEQFAIVDALIRLLRETSLSISGWEHLATWHVGSRATSPFEVGNARAGSSSVVFQVVVVEA